ncbi:YeeE/YedE family protein [Amaricoccus solimangrovi]|uniref:YeeE/YedE family protein n=1 Tax=Amaricoccus solimangrovi TaxID=2589815 RepID=A0A501WPM0_9RHOB|nr:YeeE/YedE family protein [Amaricoccus solimangrovi]TPE51399.1 YeeE/YedE family protein [Amaricoccus solimangrovi]
MTSFTPFASLAGGALIGLAAVLLMTLAGRVFGATGVLTGAFLPTGPGDRGWRLALLAGMVTAPLLWRLFAGAMPALSVPVGPLALAIGGLLVGVGVTLGGGCTSGHGVCGMARLSPRSIVATLTFLATAIVTVYVIRHVIGVQP